MKKVNIVTRKTLDVKVSDRSSNFIAPTIGYGCLAKCAYCYRRRNKPDGVDIAINLDDIITAIDNHCARLPAKQPDQTHAKYWTYDISCNEDYALHLKYHNWHKLFNYFVDNNKAFGTFATKYVKKDLLEFNPKKKMRIRFSLMPQEYSDVLEPNTSKIKDRIEAVSDFYEAGYDVHLNFSPVIVTKDSTKLYRELFEQVNDIIPNNIKSDVLAEVIFLTHSPKMHLRNKIENKEAEKLLWNPLIQESKITSFGGQAIRYKSYLKADYISGFKKLHNNIIPWNTIRYIF